MTESRHQPGNRGNADHVLGDNCPPNGVFEILR